MIKWYRYRGLKHYLVGGYVQPPSWVSFEFQHSIRDNLTPFKQGCMIALERYPTAVFSSESVEEEKP